MPSISGCSHEKTAMQDNNKTNFDEENECPLYRAVLTQVRERIRENLNI